MKKITFPLILLIVVFASCNKTKSTDHKIIGISQCSDDAWRRTMNDEMIREASFYPGFEVKIKTAHDSNQKQIRDIESFIADGVDLIIVSPNEAIPLTPVIEKAMLEGIPVVLVDRKTNSGKYTAFVGADNYEVGKEVGIYASNLLNGSGSVVELRGLKGSTPDSERHRGFMSVIATQPDIKIVYQDYGDWLHKVAKEKMKNAISQKCPIDLVFAFNDEMATGAHEAITVTSGIKKPIILGIDALPGSDGGIQKVINGTLDATFIYPTGGEKAIQTAVHILNNEPYEKENILYTAVVDKTNARVLKLQTDQIIQHQSRISQLNNVLNVNLEKYSSQRLLLFGALLVLTLILILLVLLVRAYVSKNKFNKLLQSQNIAILKQKEELSEQRDQLIALSKNLEDATQAKLVFFTNISHEFRTPLTLIQGPLDTLMNKEQLSPEGKVLVKLMRKNTLVLLKLIDQIIDFRKYENGKMQMYFTLSDLKVFVREICDSFVELGRRKHIHFSFKGSNDDFTLWFDSDKIEKICYNLLSNAFKFTSENGKIEVKLSRIEVNGDFFAQLIVSDTGTGISDHHLHNVFDRFYKVDTHVAGSGIGLHLTRMLVESHNGVIKVDSVEGKGSVFTIEIPFKQKEITISEQYPTLITPIEREEVYDYEPEPDTSESSGLKTEKPLILLVEDNLDLRGYIRSLLNVDYEIIEAPNGQVGLQKAMKHVPELIISDVIMDVMDGFELCNQVKTNLSTSHIPVILLTACGQDEQRAIGFESGADAYIPKPFNEGLLKIRIRKLIENREKVKEYFQQSLTFGDKSERKENVAEIDKSFINKFRLLIEERLIDSDLNVDEIGKHLGLSRVQLYRKIKSLTNYAPNELVRIIRLKAAEQLLINTEKTISEIAYDAGFSSPSYFTKCFREYFNESPTDYAKRIRS